VLNRKKTGQKITTQEEHQEHLNLRPSPIQYVSWVVDVMSKLKNHARNIKP